MSEIMRPIPFAELINQALREYKNNGSVFGIREEKFYRNKSGAFVELFGVKLSSPLGPAAGPNSQLAQNILAAYLAGSRFIECKTVQIMDGEELRKAIARPCINTADEGYNVEWSTELTVEEALEEYVKAWFLCHVFGKEFGLENSSTAGSRGLIFNMSVGYSLEGIKSPKIDAFINGMKDAKNTGVWRGCYKHLEDTISCFKNFSRNDLDRIPSAVSSGITLSTLHGCPREEIEKIAAYLIGEKGLHTYIKCNPTLLGYETARKLLDEMGYNYISFDDHHFKNDLQFSDATVMLRNLLDLAKGRNLSFGVKLTNTFPVEIKRGELPGDEMYMSGRSLFPLSINAAKKLTGAFNGELPISYSGGADYFNLAGILETGIRPVTVATTILKPGGYERLTQLACLAEEVLAGGGITKSPAISAEALDKLAAGIPRLKRYRKEYREKGSKKAGLLPLFNCAKAPCQDDGCPIHQRIPDYLEETAKGNYREAFRIIALDNTAPSITGTICDHQCQSKCTRLDYEDPLQIRMAKLLAAENGEESFTGDLKPEALKTDKKIAVIGAGPGGIAAAVFLRRNGAPVTVFEKREKPYGIVQYVIPAFRIADAAIDRDYTLALKLGVEFKFKAPEAYSLSELKKNYKYVVIATGAWKEGASPVKKGGGNIIDALKFLEESKQSNCALRLGKTVAVIGGGDVAMDCARAAKRNRGVDRVTVVYRRTKEFMPAQGEERELAEEDGVEFLELLSPESFEKGILQCEVMRLGDFDSSGRRTVEGTGAMRSLSFDTVIGAVGARVDTELFRSNGVALNEKGYPLLSSSGESSVPGVYIAGDCKAGPATVVQAIAGAKSAASDILAKLGLEADFSASPSGVLKDPEKVESAYRKKGIIAEKNGTKEDAGRCLSCAAVCEICVDVCPNRANVMIAVDGALESQPGSEGSKLPLSDGAGLAGGTRQILHLDGNCNECGNCAVFCPYTGRPYKDKFTLFKTEEDFKDSENPGFLPVGDRGLKLRLEDRKTIECKRGDKILPPSYASMIETAFKNYRYLIEEVK
jgi:putative selenate reductase